MGPPCCFLRGESLMPRASRELKTRSEAAVSVGARTMAHTDETLARDTNCASRCAPSPPVTPVNS